MAGTHYTLTIDDAQARALLARLGEPGTQDLMPRLGEYLQRATQQRFDDQRRPDGEKWEDLKERYRRRKKYHQDKILTLRGYLRRGIHYQVTGPSEVEVGSSTKYAAIHQFGGVFDRTSTVRYRSQAGRVLFAKKTQKAGVTSRVVNYQLKKSCGPRWASA
jgi:phage virion morphogenesis protein